MTPATTLTVFLIAAIIAVIVIVFVSIKKPRTARLDGDWYRSQWQQIEDTLTQGDAGRLLAVVNADKLLDRAMIESGFRGQTMGERLKSGGTTFSNLNGVWTAHKLRNRIAHESSVRVNEREAREALANVRRALVNLGALV